MKKIIINNINCLINYKQGMRYLVVYCHGFGSNKESIEKHVKALEENDGGIISFDFPGHGEDKTDNKDITYDMCYKYIDEVVKYVTDKYPKTKIALMGSSFGGYMALNYINDSGRKFYRTFLKYPAINLYECIKRKLNIDDSYFDNHEYFELPNGYRLYKKFYLDAKEHDIMHNFNKHNNDIYIVQGNIDKIVLADDIIDFVKRNGLQANIIINGDHGLDRYMEIVNDELVTFMF